jgi:type IV secretion system protein VirB10
MVTAPVYDSRTGTTLLVPQGARLYGGYDSHVGGNQNRALLVWHRLMMPNGRSVELDHMRGTDAAGYAGVSDAVDYHADQLALGAALSGVIAYAGNFARNGQAAQTAAADTIGDTVAQQAARTGSRIVDRQLDAQPTITVRPGWPVRVLVNRDVTLEPYAD